MDCVEVLTVQITLLLYLLIDTIFISLYDRQPLSEERVGNLTAQCNMNCGCLASQFDPVCSVNGITYFSPCHAGCQSINATDSLEQQVRNAPIE